MRVLMVQFCDPRLSDPLPVFQHSTGVLAAMLKREGFSCSLVTLAGYQADRLKNAVIHRRPQYVLVDLASYSVAAAHRMIGEVAETFSLPVAVMGQYATVRPDRAISIPGVHALLIGEYEQAGVALLRAVRDGDDPSGADGLWIHTDAGLVKGGIGPLIEDLDSLPFPDRELFDYGRLVSAEGEASFKVARGCPHWCSYCANDWYMDLYADAGTFVRRRSVANVLDEVAEVICRYEGAESIAFYDHCFALDADWIAAFAEDYPRHCTLPYRCQLHLGGVTEELAAMLARSLCRCVHVHIGAGSRFIREEILSMHVSNGQIVQACRVLRQAGLHVAAEVFIGCPYESEITVEETLKLLRDAKVHEVHPRVFYPTPGARAAELCAENGWISGRSEDNYWTQHTVLDMPSLPAEHVNAVVRKFPSLLKRPRNTSLRKLLEKVRRSRRRNIPGLGR